MPADLDSRPDILFVIEWATVSLYEIAPGSATRAQPWGKPDPSRYVFSGFEAENLQIRESLETSERRVSGFKFPYPRHLSRSHSISIDRLWITKPLLGDVTAPDDLFLQANRLYCLYVLWQEPVNGKSEADSWWRSRTYYGVTTPEYNHSSSADAVAFTGQQSLSAMFYKRKSGKGSPPQISA